MNESSPHYTAVNPDPMQTSGEQGCELCAFLRKMALLKCIKLAKIGVVG